MSLDALKERLHAAGVGGDDRFALRRAAEVELAARLKVAAGPLVVDIWVAPRRDTERVVTLLRRHTGQVIELLCRVPVDIAVQRYADRRRGGVHLPADEPTLQRIREAVDQIEPLGLGAYLEIDTSTRVDPEAILDRLDGAASANGWRRRSARPTTERPGCQTGRPQV